MNLADGGVIDTTKAGPLPEMQPFNFRPPDRWHNPTVTSPSGPGAGVNDLLLETGDHLLLEDGTSVLVLEG